MSAGVEHTRPAPPALRLGAVLNPPGKGEARIDASATMALVRQVLTLERLQASYRGQTTTLVQPARISLANGVAIAAPRLRAGQATVTPSRQSESTARVWWETPRCRSRSSALESRAASTGRPPSATGWARTRPL